MCGIAGTFEYWCERSPDPAYLEAMAVAISHRGPDDQGIVTGDYYGLVSRRLAIIGIASGHQPISNEDGTIWIVFNGEIYNHHLLRALLEQKGHQFKTSTDTEAILHLYEEYGGECVSQLEGMFAFAVVDTNEKTLLLARDRFGQKPLYYHLADDGHFSFASELPSLLQDPAVRREIRYQSVFDYLSLGYIAAPYSIFRDVYKLPPACTLHLRFGDKRKAFPHPKCYWQLPFSPKTPISFQDAVNQTRVLLEQAVEKRLESEVPLGAFLSGGIDSSLVTALMQHRVSSSVKTFSIGFEVPRYDERGYAQEVADLLGTEHHVNVAEPRDVDLLRRIVRHVGEPFADSSILPTALLSEFTRKHVTVALSGDAGDELFGGYRRYQAMALYRLLSRLPRPVLKGICRVALSVLPENREQRTRLSTLRRALHALRLPEVQSYASYQEIFSHDAKCALLRGSQVDAFDDYTSTWVQRISEGTAREFVEQFMALDIQEYLPGDLLCKVDIASMMASLEVRSPFLDHPLAEFVASLPRSYKVGRNYSKRLLKVVAEGEIPASVIRRSKAGFGVPLSGWLRNDLSAMIREMVSSRPEWDPDGVFNHRELKCIAEEHLRGHRDHSFRLWVLLCYRLWYEEIQVGL